MNILFISSANQPDYQCDVIYHGLKMLYGTKVESVNDIWFMYDDLVKDEQKFLYGLGFTLYGNLPASLRNVQSPQNVMEKLRNKFYDLVIYGSIQRDKSFLNTVLSNYQKEKIVFIDGEDWTKVSLDLVPSGIYFKRELEKPIDGVLPIGFGIPENKIQKVYQKKTKKWSFNRPGNLSTYIYKTEDSYYQDYQQSEFALTTKKAGWDCLRHYEIIANGALPYFPDLGNCPVNILSHYPKERQHQLNKKIKNNIVLTEEDYFKEVDYFTTYLKKYLTTTAVVEYLLKCVEEYGTKKTDLKLPKIEDKNFGIPKIDLLIAKFNDFLPRSILYSGVGNAQAVRYIDANKYEITTTDIFVSVENSLRKESESYKNFTTDLLFDCIVLDNTLTYSANLGDTLRDAAHNLSPGGQLIVLVPNFKILWNYLAIYKNRLNFNRLDLSKSAPVNLFSADSIKKTLEDYNFKVKTVDLFGFQSNNTIKEKLNKIDFLQKHLNTHILITATKPNENND